MNKANETTNSLTTKLIALGEVKLAVRVAVCNVESHIVAVQSSRMAKKNAKHNLRVEKQTAKIEKLTEDIPKIIMSHQKKN